MARTVTAEQIENFKVVLRADRVTETTIDKYVNDVENLTEYLADREVTPEELERYKVWLIQDKQYKESSVNSFIASINRFLRTMNWQDCELTMFNLTNSGRDMSEKYISREDYKRLVLCAMQNRDYRTAMLIQTLCHINLRFSELEQVTVEAVKTGKIKVTRRNKTFYLAMSENLRESLLIYARQAGIESGIIFRSNRGKVLDRSNSWRRIKELCEMAGVDTERVSLVKIKMPVMNDYYPFYEMAE